MKRSMTVPREFPMEIFNAIPNPIFVVDGNRNLVLANEAFCRLAGIGAGVLPGTPLTSCFTIAECARFHDPFSGQASWEQDIKGAMSEPKPYHVSALTAHHDNRELCLFTLRDQSVMRQAEASLAESESLYMTLVNQIPNPVVIHAGGKVLFANALLAQLTGFTMQEILGKEVVQLLSDQSDPLSGKVFERLAEEGFPGEQELEVRTDGRKILIRNFLVRNSPIRYRGSDALLTILIDITERKYLEKYIIGRVIDSEEKSRKQFAIDLHDDLGPLLSGIKLHLGLLERETAQGAPAGTLAVIRKLLDEAIFKMRRIANNLMPRLITNFGLEAALSAFIESLRQQGELGIDFRSNLGDRRLQKQLELHLYRIIAELLNNTIKHAGATHVDLSLVLVKRKLTLTYSDNGKGYDVEEVRKRPGGMGVENILHRASLVDASVTFSKKGKNTIVKIVKWI